MILFVYSFLKEDVMLLQEARTLLNQYHRATVSQVSYWRVEGNADDTEFDFCSHVDYILA